MHLNPFQKKILSIIKGSANRKLSDSNFNTLALDSFNWQIKNNDIYRQYCDSIGVKDIKSWMDIPALPISAFKYHDVSCFKKKKSEETFFTSGTTASSFKGVHRFHTMKFYNRTIDALWPALLVKKKKNHFIHLIPYKKLQKNSSLSYMSYYGAKKFGGKNDFYAIGKKGPKWEELTNHLMILSSKNTKSVILSTTLAIYDYVDYLKKAKVKLNLPEGTILMDTGGAKTRKADIDRSRLLKKIQSYLGIQKKYTINEYGMTELSSQFYDKNFSMKKPQSTDVKFMPPWTRVLIIDPDTGKVLPKGKKGVIRIFDLANQNSCCFIQTEDMGRLVSDGFKVLGRKPKSDLRGCSLTFEEMKSLNNG